MLYILRWIFGDIKRESKKLKETWELAYGVGMQEGVDKGLRMGFDKSNGLDEATYSRVIAFLINEGVELVCFNAEKGGLRIKKAEVRKRYYNQHKPK